MHCRTFVSFAILPIAGILAGCGGTPESASETVMSQRLEWPMHIIDRHLRNSDGLEMGDINRDGLPDFCTAWEFDEAITIGIHPGPEKLSEPWPIAQVATVGDSDEAIFWDGEEDGYADVLYVQGPDTPVSGIGVSWNPGPERVLDPKAWEDGGLFPVTEPLKKFLVLFAHGCEWGRPR